MAFLCQHVPVGGCLGTSKRHTSVALNARPAGRRALRRTARVSVIKDYERVSDAMTSGKLYSCTPDDTVDQALEMLVEYRITGLPVISQDNQVVGVVSDFDLLALDTLGKTNDDRALFPAADQSWQAFKEVKSLIAKSAGKKVKDVMTAKPITVSPDTDLEAAARILLSKKIRRLPVVDENGKLVGLLTRGNIIKAALSARKAAAQVVKS